MEKYLLELIKEHNRVIVPNFGAFIVSREKGETILFNSFLSFNDGLLINHICKADGVDSATAMAGVEDFVNTIKQTLDAKGVFELKQLGTFTKDQNGILRFIQKEQQGATNAESPAQKATLKKETSDLLDIDADGVTKAEISEEPLKQEFSPDKEKLLIIDNTPPVIQPTTPTAKPETKKPAAPKKSVEKEKKQPIRRGLPLWLVILLIVLPILLIVAYFVFFKGPKKEVAPPPPVEQPAAEEPAQEAVEEETPVVEIPEAVITTRQHHIIVGSFKEESNASKLVTRLKEKGLSNASVLNYQGRFLVSAEWHPSVNKALQRQEELLNQLQMENWVLSLK